MELISSTGRQRLERIWIIAKTDYLQRYYGSVLGVFWAFLNPFFRVLVYYFAFTYLIFKNRDSDFILYLFSGISIWTVFAENTNKGLNLLKSKKYLIQNIGINKVDLFVAAALSTLFAFLLNIFVYFIFTAFFDVQFSARLLFVPFLLINLYLICMGVAMILAVLRLFVNDLNHVWDVLLFVGFWSVPIIWNYKYVYETYPWFLYVNPITGILINFRFLVLYDLPIDWSVFAIDYLYGFVLWFIGFWMLKQFSHKAVEFE